MENTFKLHLEDKVDNQEFPTYHFQDNKKFLISISFFDSGTIADYPVFPVNTPAFRTYNSIESRVEYCDTIFGDEISIEVMGLQKKIHMKYSYQMLIIATIC